MRPTDEAATLFEEFRRKRGPIERSGAGHDATSIREEESAFPPIDPRIVAFTGHRNPTANCEMGPLRLRSSSSSFLMTATRT